MNQSVAKERSNKYEHNICLSTLLSLWLHVYKKSVSRKDTVYLIESQIHSYYFSINLQS